ncbi:ABC transporter permease [Paenibacillus macerans]|uniref:Binding--dependent transport system inner membrane component family protein n=2 Tax=Paenibacillus macerans TaxID=44252 RepID=A0A090YCK7_PAEMA|nr:sugar ABC transporter permease [Paenibacillus macerans]KFM95926.1 binding--dependent transport system inner membrane component family protein [Paenibacillus macerans]MCY7560530.1 sugar ABC transporter permease [Paenibacillus macerans]MDU7477829.1 sugar ABC transporter permease [Paenibacillus macerans]MEC0140704.1 sugar ABC transporter permease [Paenibacillus macerans]MEC0153287.1 sugar ABC transporter permease [Paenibacillus macerans]
MMKLWKQTYSYTFLLPAAIVYTIIFLIPTALSFFFSLTRWTLSDWEFIGLENFVTFFQESSLSIGFKNTLIYALVTCVAKVVLGLLLGTFLTSKIKTKGYLQSVLFFPTLVSTIAVGVAFSTMMHPTQGVINQALQAIGITGPDWLGNTKLALLSVAFVDVWKGVGFATVIFVAGILSIPEEYYEALQIDGGSAWNKFWNIIVPLSRPAMNSVIILSFIGGLRSFDLIWAMTKGGPGFTTDVIASIIYKQYQGGFYGLATAGNVILFLFVSLLAFPLSLYLNRKEVSL